MKVLIIGNGDLDRHPLLPGHIDDSDLLIAADGGANHCFRLKLVPDVLLGDLDSVSPAVLAHYRHKKVAIVQYPVQKDATDLELALDLAVERGAKSIILAGVLGGRWDMSLSNILLAATDKYIPLTISLLGEDCAMHVLHPGRSHHLTPDAGTRVSLLALHGDVQGVSLSGFAYPLTDHTLTCGSSLGISNRIVQEHGTVHIKKGTLLCIQSPEE